MTNKRNPVLPSGNAGVFTGISENFSFHASPESFIQTQILKYYQQHPGNAQRRTAVRAKILNRNVVILSAYDHVKQVLEVENEAEALPLYVAAAPYRQLMEDFFPSPNLLLKDGCPHHQIKVVWEAALQRLESEDHDKKLHDVSSIFVSNLKRNTPFDLYSSLKAFAWQLLLAHFLGLHEDDQNHREYIKLQEDLLRGQFSVFPVSVNAGFWQSPRKKGIDARKKLQTMIAQKMLIQTQAWLPNESAGKRPQEEVVNHILMATSSLAVKAFASLLLAFLLNMYLFKANDGETDLYADCRARVAVDGTKTTAKAILRETSRLSPPVVGIMRRATTDSSFKSRDNSSSEILVPEGWDIWSYFPGANRDTAMFGQDADRFRPDRYLPSETCGEPAPEPIIFGLGHKRCLGASFVPRAALAVLKAFEDAGVRVEGEVDAPGVRGWLGWQIATAEEWAKDMKQLPTQRPSRPIEVRVVPCK